MKKIGVIAGISFISGVLFFALTFGFLQDNGNNRLVLSPSTLHAQTQTVEKPFVAAKGISFAPVVKKVRAAVVRVDTQTVVQQRSRFNDDFLDRFFNTPRRNSSERKTVPGTGSGFFISSDGYILTNNHVIENAIKITIKDINNKEYPAKKIGTDPKTDLALLKIEGENFPYLELGNSDTLEVGEWVLAVGNPLGQELSVTSGIVSAKGRELQGLDVDYQNFIQTDAAINQGNSGGPLINMSGKAIGINSAILSTSGGNIGIGFAIPSNMAGKVIADLKKEGRVIRGYLGVQIMEVKDSEAKEFDLPTGGVLIAHVEEGTPAKNAGLEKFDLITGIDGKPVKSPTKLRNIIAGQNPGDTITLEIYREGKKKEVTVKVMEAPDSMVIRPKDKEGSKVIDLGMVLMDNSPEVARRYELETSKGIIVTEIERGGVAAEHGLQRGDIILGVNRTEIQSVTQFRRIMSQKSGSRVFLTINRNGRETFLRFSVPE